MIDFNANVSTFVAISQASAYRALRYARVYVGSSDAAKVSLAAAIAAFEAGRFAESKERSIACLALSVGTDAIAHEAAVAA